MPQDLPFAAFDERVDQALEKIRDKKVVVVVFSIASAVGDFGILWHVIGLLRSIGSMDRLQQALVFSGMIGLESLILNQGIKRLFRRSRPTERGDDRFALRKPRTSSFPSGHSTISVATYLVLAIVLAGLVQRRRSRAMIHAVATLLILSIGFSRVYLGVHWPTDVLAGWALGATWAVVGWFLLSREPAGAAGPP